MIEHLRKELGNDYIVEQDNKRYVITLHRKGKAAQIRLSQTWILDNGIAAIRKELEEDIKENKK